MDGSIAKILNTALLLALPQRLDTVAVRKSRRLAIVLFIKSRNSAGAYDTKDGDCTQKKKSSDVESYDLGNCLARAGRASTFREFTAASGAVSRISSHTHSWPVLCEKKGILCP